MYIYICICIVLISGHFGVSGRLFWRCFLLNSGTEHRRLHQPCCWPPLSQQRRSATTPRILFASLAYARSTI